MKIITLILITIFSIATLAADQPDAETIIRRVDENITPETRIATTSMVVHGRRGSRTIRSRSWIRGTEQAFTEYLAPPREAGTKMLKLGDELWIFSPATDRTIQISGHMLREPVMGSDLSYEDHMEDPQISGRYTPVIEGEEEVMDRDCWVIYLRAKVDDVSYPYIRIWVDQERYLPLKEEWYGRGESLLKTLEVKEVMQVQERWFPKRMVVKDVLKDGDGTELIIEEIEFDADIPDHIFSRAALRD